MRNVTNIFYFSAITLFAFVAACKKDDAVTPPENPPVNTSAKVATVTTDSIYDVTTSTATFKGKVVANGGAAVTVRGVCWSLNPEPTIDGSKADAATVKGSGEFICNIKGLVENKLYYIRSYAINSAGVAYGNEKTFTATAIKLSSITVKPIHIVGVTLARAYSNITDDGGGAITARGLCWSLAHNPTINDQKTVDGKDRGEFTSNMTGLTAATVYYVRAYATNAAGTVYSNEISIKTTAQGNVRYTLVKEANPTAEQSNAYNLIQQGMDKAMLYYNNYTSISKNITVYYVPGVPTADGNTNGTIRFGSNMAYTHQATCMHESAHTMGIGTTNSWWNTLMIGGTYRGANALAKLRALTNNPNAMINGDSQHFWPYGLNSSGEVQSDLDYIYHCLLMEEMKKDGLFIN
jgi:hypothetical protein